MESITVGEERLAWSGVGCSWQKRKRQGRKAPQKEVKLKVKEYPWREVEKMCSWVPFVAISLSVRQWHVSPAEQAYAPPAFSRPCLVYWSFSFISTKFTFEKKLILKKSCLTWQGLQWKDQVSVCKCQPWITSAVCLLSDFLKSYSKYWHCWYFLDWGRREKKVNLYLTLLDTVLEYSWVF